MKKSVPRPLTLHPYTHHPPPARLGGTGAASSGAVTSSTPKKSLLNPRSTYRTSPAPVDTLLRFGLRDADSGEPGAPQATIGDTSSGEHRSGVRAGGPLTSSRA